MIEDTKFVQNVGCGVRKGQFGRAKIAHKDGLYFAWR